MSRRLSFPPRPVMPRTDALFACAGRLGRRAADAAGDFWWEFTGALRELWESKFGILGTGCAATLFTAGLLAAAFGLAMIIVYAWKVLWP